MNQRPDYTKDPVLAPLLQWKEAGYTDIVVFGRFQPLHKGHMAFLNTLRVTGLNVHLVLNDKTDGIDGERNPFSPAQKREMVKLALPWMKEENVHEAHVYLGGGGDVGDGVRRLTDIFNSLAKPKKLVFAYFEKAEDRKQYLVDGQTINDAHYVELVGQPRGPFPIQRITQEMIEAVDNYIPIDAKMFRKGVREGDTVAYELLHPEVAQYVADQFVLAERNNRLVGASQENDIFTMAHLKQERGGQGGNNFGGPKAFS